MSTGAWSAAWKARTLKEAHEALVVLRPLPEAARSVWVTYYRRSSEVYRHVAEVDDGHQVHANYWADREKAKADQLAGSADRSSAGTSGARRKRRSNASVAVDAVPSTLEAVHDWLSKARPTGDAAKAVWLAYHEHAAAALRGSGRRGPGAPSRDAVLRGPGTAPGSGIVGADGGGRGERVLSGLCVSMRKGGKNVDERSGADAGEPLAGKRACGRDG